MVQTRSSLNKETAPKSLTELLGPFSLSDFFKIFGENYLYLPGKPARFSSLFPWEVLNNVLRQHRLNYPRMRVFCDGKRVPVDAYTKVSVGRKNRSTSPKLISGDLIGQLQDGATLVIDAVDELYEPLTVLASSLEREFREHIQVNLYAGFHTSPGFDLHWDDHDVIILQIAGRKSWAIYGDTRKYPLANDIFKDKTPPAEPIWKETISDGDLLYIPRGFWHVATPLDEPSLHLTIGIPNRTGIDLLTWLTQQLRSDDIFRKDLPKFKNEVEQKAHYSQLFNALKVRLNQATVDQFIAHCDASAMPRFWIDLPEIASKKTLGRLDGKTYQITTPRRLVMSDEGETLVVRANKKVYRFASAAKPLLEFIDQRKPFNIYDLTAAAKGSLDDRTISAFIKELLSSGLISTFCDL